MTRGKTTYEYDKHNNPIKSKTIRGKYSTVHKVAYIYDKTGNWIKRTTTTTNYEDGKVCGNPNSVILERKITYYTK